MVQPTDAAGFILVGGRSSRMGQDKALMPFRGMPLASYIAQQLLPSVHQLSFIGDFAKYGHLGPITPDHSPGIGPLGAVVSALRETQTPWNVIVACDLPAVQSEWFSELVLHARNSSAQCVVPVTPDGREQVLCAAYRRDALPALEQALADGDLSLRSAIRRLSVDFWPVATGDWARNVNTPGEWEAFLQES